MRVLLVNTSDSIGGAAIACRRLMDALTRNGVEVRMLTAPRRRGFICKALERVMMLPFVGFSWRKSWAIDVNWLGTDITHTDDFKWADVVHLHWVNQGMLSIGQIGKIAHSGKRVVWTMHDVWNATAVCHLTLDCQQYTQNCRQCPRTMPFLARHTWKRKQHLYSQQNIVFTTCSRWLRSQALESGLMCNQSVHAVPNPIDTSIFHPSNRDSARRIIGIENMNMPLVLFVAQYINNPNKGARYLMEAMRQLSATCDIGLIIMGSNGREVAEALPEIKIYDLGYQTNPEHIAKIYAAADVFVLPSLSENLPNTIMEAMACGVPCVGFDIGGIPEMIDHERNGYIAQPRNVQQLADGIRYCLVEENHERLSQNCIRKVMERYSQKAVAEKFLELYK